MKKIAIVSTILMALIFNGCAAKSAKDDYEVFTFEKVGDSETLLNAKFAKKGKHINVYFIVISAMNGIKSEVARRGYKYFQIVSPDSLNNLKGFPITNKNALASYLNPNMSIPREKIGFLETNQTLMDNQLSQSAVSIPFTIFQDTTFEVVVRLIKEPEFDEIVWEAK